MLRLIAACDFLEVASLGAGRYLVTLHLLHPRKTKGPREAAKGEPEEGGNELLSGVEPGDGIDIFLTCALERSSASVEGEGETPANSLPCSASEDRHSPGTWARGPWTIGGYRTTSERLRTANGTPAPRAPSCHPRPR